MTSLPSLPIIPTPPTVLNEKRLSDFVEDENGKSKWRKDPIQTQLLSGSWAISTLESYTSGVRKFLAFGSTLGKSRKEMLPASDRLVQEFIAWAGRRIHIDDDVPIEDEPHKIKASTLDNYLTGLRSWHLFHDKFYPEDRSHKIRLLLKAAKQGDQSDVENLKAPKRPVLLRHLSQLLFDLAPKGRREHAALAIALTAFWGMARLGELVPNGKLKRKIVRMRDVTWGPNQEWLKISIRDAKTAAPGEIQTLFLKRQPSFLDAVSAIERLVEDNSTRPCDPLFSYLEPNGTRSMFSKTKLIGVFKRVWKAADPGHDLTGHSFRVGGATLRWNNKVPLDTVIELGRWQSKAYQLYLRKYSPEEAKDAVVWWKKLSKK